MTVALPLASVVAEAAERVPHVPVVVKLTWSPLTPVPPAPSTTALTVDVEEPSGARVAGLAEAVTVTWVILAVPDAPAWDSVAVIVHVPAVEEAV